MLPSASFRESMRISGRTLVVPLGGALLGAVLMAVLHGATGGVPWVLLSAACWIYGGPLVLLAAGFCLWKRGPQHEDLRALVVGAIAFLVLLLPAHLAGGWFRDRTVRSWLAEGAVLAGRIEEVRNATGAYPSTLDGVAGAGDLEWKSLLTYRTCVPEDAFTLEVRNPDSFLFPDTWIWNPATRAWDYVVD